MKFIRTLSLKNLRRKPARTAALVLLAALLSASVFGGSVVVSSLRNGLRSYEARLGADIVVVPYQATTKASFDSILLQGIPGSFYMEEQYYRKIRSIEGVEAASPQFYLASASAGCCSVPVQLIGFDPETDFSIQPWISQTYGGALGYQDVIVGSDINLTGSGVITFFNTDCRIVAQLEKTGTGLDTAVYMNMDTIRLLMKNAEALGFPYFDGLDPDRAVSSVMVKVADGYDIAAVTGDINIHVRHVVASQAANMVSNIAGGLGSVSRVIGLLTGMIWLLAVVILAIAFAMISHERAKEFAVLRCVGASRKMIAGLLLTESALISLAGAVLGLALSALVVFPFSRMISSRLQLPYLQPGGGQIAAVAVGSLLLAVAVGALTSAVSAYRISRSDAGLILREDV